MEPIQVSAKTLDEAITKACIELGVTSDNLDYKIVSTGSNGVFGFGAKPYVLSASAKAAEEDVIEPEVKKAAPAAEDKAPAVKEAKAEVKENKEPEKTVEKLPEAEKKDAGNAAFAEERKKPEAKKDRDFRKDNRKENRRPADDQKKNEQSEVKERPVKLAVVRDDTKAKAESFLKTIFDGMGMTVDIEMYQDEESGEFVINLSGDDMGVLIGKRGQTLDAIQYLTSQVVNKHESDYIRVKLDTENYRGRRKETLETLAKNIASRVRKSRRPLALEPMNPYERRIIHSVLQNEKDITTRSEGEEPYRHVVICCTKKKSR